MSKACDCHVARDVLSGSLEAAVAALARVPSIHARDRRCGVRDRSAPFLRSLDARRAHGSDGDTHDLDDVYHFNLHAYL